MNHVRLYRNELTHLGYGNPVWEPNPGTLYDCIRIGDVGYFQNDQFMPLFNILQPDDSNGTRRLPFPQPDFPVLCLPANYPNTQDRNPLEAGVYALESSLTFSASVGVDSVGSVLHGESSLSFTNEKGAALILPSEACREDTLYDKLFKQHMLKYYRQWYTFALTECQRDIKLCDLILVTGCDLTRQWATATYFRSNREISAALGAQVAPVAEAKFSLSAGWSTTQAMNTRRGPPQAFRQQPREDNDETQNNNGTLVNNQCIFLRGFYVKDRLWGPQVMKAGAGYHDPGTHSPEEEGTEGVLANDDVTVESLLPSTQGRSFMSVLLDYMLEESDANVVIANDSDLWPYLGEAENPENLRDTLKRMLPHIKVEEGVGSLIMQDIEASELAKKKECGEALLTNATATAGAPGIDPDEATAPSRKRFSILQTLSSFKIMGRNFSWSPSASSPIPALRNDQRPSGHNEGVANTMRKVPMACTNCRQKKLKCCAPDNIQRKCSRCIEADLPCEYVPVNHSPTTDIDPFLLGPQDTVPSQPQSPHFGPNPPTTSYDSSSAHPITSGWFGADSAQQQREKKKKRHYYGEQSLGGGQGWDAQPTWDDQNMRSNSLHRVPLKRSASRGHVNTLTYGHEPYSTLNLARRPRDWRPDYTPRGGIAALTAYLLGVGRSRSDVQELADPVRRHLHPLLLWDPQAPPVHFDLRHHSFLPEHIRFVNLNRPHNGIDLAQLVCQPSSSLLRISHPQLPWYIDVQQFHPNGVTVNDIFERIHAQLHAQIQDKDFFNQELNETDRTHITNAFNARVGANARLRAAGVLRVDFLGDKCVFEGLVRSARGVWEMKTTRPQPLG